MLDHYVWREAASQIQKWKEQYNITVPVSINLSLTPIYDKIVEITELLRNRTEMDYSGMLSDILRLRDELGELCK